MCVLKQVGTSMHTRSLRAAKDARAALFWLPRCQHNGQVNYGMLIKVGSNSNTRILATACDEASTGFDCRFNDVSAQLWN